MLLLYLVITFCASFIFYVKWHYNYWKRKGFPYVKAKNPFGVLDSVRKRERSAGMAIYDVYKSHKERLLGIYLFSRPAILVRDAALARDVLTKEFISFHDRGVCMDTKSVSLTASMFAMKGQKWKALRSKLAPLFSSGKLKGVFGTVEEVSNRMVDYLKTKVPEDGRSVELELKQIVATYAIDIIGSSIFGLEVNSFEHPDNEFHKLSKIVNEPTLPSVMRGTCQFLHPSLEKLFVALGWIEKAPKMMLQIVKQTVEMREKFNITRKDMLQMLLQLRNQGEINASDDVWSVKTAADDLKKMSIDEMAANLFLFYVAGFETTASTAAFTIYELTRYPELMHKVQADIEQSLEKHGQISYEALQDMKYLDLCIMETIRKYPGLPILNRECTEDYPVPDSDLVIKKGTPIVISLFGIHRDPEYFPDPLKYDPERYLEEKRNYDPVAYMPFGEGPRHCVAQRMGKVNVKVAVVQIFSNFNIETNRNQPELEIDSFGIPIMPKGGINVRLSRKQNFPGK